MAGVIFNYHVGLNGELFRNVRLTGSWDESGNYSDTWTTVTMTEERSYTGSPSFTARVNLNDSEAGKTFRWGVLLDGPDIPNQWGIPTEVNDKNVDLRHRKFVLRQGEQNEEYFLTNCRRLGANKYYLADAADPSIMFSVWAPNAQAVEMVRGNSDSGYIADDGTGMISAPGQFKLNKDESTGIWYSDLRSSPELRNFAAFDHTPYMFRITQEDGSIVYRTDLYSRCQIGKGRKNPKTEQWDGTYHDLMGMLSCSVVIDPERVTELFDEPFPQTRWLSSDDFWQNEFNQTRPIPTRVEDLIIYEMHIGGLGYDKYDQFGPVPGSLKEAMEMIDYLVELGVNAIELMPMSEFEGWASWGYATSHYLAVEFAGGGRDQFKHFVRECHQRGIVVLLDVVYNHYAHHGERAEWHYDSTRDDKNIYFWYEGQPSNYPSPDGGYVDNESTGYSPRFWDEMVRKMFISSAAQLVQEFHVDGLRVDQTGSMHLYPKLHVDGRPLEDVRAFGTKFLREFSRTLRLIKPKIMLIAEDHSGWQGVTQPTSEGGLGFDAVWYSNYYHHLIGDGERGSEYARLMKVAGLGDNRPLAMDYFAGAFNYAGEHTVVYHESHDEAGNSPSSGRTIEVAVNRAPLRGETRRYAENRCRVASGLTLLSAGIPMFFMGEEVGFQKDYRYNDFSFNKENFEAERRGNGRFLYRYYQDLIKLSKENAAFRSPNKAVIHVHNANRIIAFRRWYGQQQFLVCASLNDAPFSAGYDIYSDSLPDGNWREVFNSDSGVYNGFDIGNMGGLLSSSGGHINMVIPSNGVVAFKMVS
ncbi:MAG: alpha amylase, catalytic region [Firmicutes bacterium]|nr:alpha amylase, catalytic region [Bacillota bacterium]